jgi:pyruvate formate lyase activating enzyme
LKNNFVSNGFIGETALWEIAPLLDAINIDLKFFREASYRRISRARLQPVLDAIRLYHELGVWCDLSGFASVLLGPRSTPRGLSEAEV